MDKKDWNEQEPKTNEETAGTQPGGAETPESQTVEPPVGQEASAGPVMNKYGAADGSGNNGSNGSKSGKGWMIASIVLAAALIVVLIKPPFPQTDAKKAVATVNGTDITKQELYDKLVEAGGEQTLQSLITTKLVDQEAEKAKVTVTDADIDSEIKDLQEQFGGEEGLNSALAQSGMTIDDLKKQMPMQVQIRKLLEPKVKVTDDEIKKSFETNKASYNTEEEVRASHILVKTEAEAKAILKELEGGADFAKLASEKSEDTGSKANGGDLNFFKRGDMVPEFSDAAFKLKVGETSGAVKSDFGYHIIKVTDRKEAHTATLEEKKEEIRDTLTNQKISEMSQQWLEDLKTNAKITNTLTDEPEASPSASAVPDASAAPAASAAPEASAAAKQ